jgi:glutamate/tyrosine decarboxylase-like PLP-dependent enzyme
MRTLGYRVIDLLVDHFAEMRHEPVIRHGDRPTLEALLREPIPEEGSDLAAVLQQVQSDIFSHIASLSHPRFFGFVPSPSNFVGVMAETLAAGYNIFNGSWLVASGPAQVELVTIDWLRQLVGLPETAGGLFVSGGSVASLTALAVARRRLLDDCIPQAVVYSSDQTHSSIERALHLLGFAPDQLRIIPSDAQFRLPLPALRQQIDEDRAQGKRPFCVVANAGTTNTGAVDPLEPLAALCQADDLWLHIDAAYGGPAVLTERGRRALSGLGLADSLALDPHKWLFQPIEMGCVLVRDSTWLTDTFVVHPDYLRDVDRASEEVNFRDYGIQLTRSFRALKLWMSLKVFGLDAFRRAIQRGITLAERAEALLRAVPSCEVVTSAQLGIVTFRFTNARLSPDDIDAMNNALVPSLMADGFALITSTVLRGRTVLRLCTINPRTTEEDIRGTIGRLEAMVSDEGSFLKGG